MRNRIENKGVYVRENKRGISYEAYVTVSNNGKRSKRTFKAHVGTYPTMQQAIEARMQFIQNLK